MAGVVWNAAEDRMNITLSEPKLISFLSDWMHERASCERRTFLRLPVWSTLPKLDKVQDAEHRFDLLCKYYNAALSRLSKRQQQIIKLSKVDAMMGNYHQLIEHNKNTHKGVLDFDFGYPLATIKKIMNFYSMEEMEAFKEDAFRTFLHEFVGLIKNDVLHDKSDELLRKFLDECLERHLMIGLQVNRKQDMRNDLRVTL